MMYDAHDVVIITRDVNGERYERRMTWDKVCVFASNNKEDLEDEEILLIVVEDTCIYSSLMTDKVLTWDDITGFFA